MKKWILIGVLMSTLTALCGCLLLGDGSAELGTINKGLLKFVIFYLPLLIVLGVTLKLLVANKHYDMGRKIMLLVLVPNLMLIPLIMVWVGFASGIEKVLAGG